MNNIFEKTLEIEGKTIRLQTGQLAKMAGGAVVASCGGTHVLATATISKSARPGVDFLPLMVNYNEKLYAGGIIKGSRFIKREGRPSDDKILMGRVVDRQLRPLFPKHIRRDIQVMITTLSYDGEQEHDMLAGLAASAALSLSEVPWKGPVANVRVGRMGEEFIINPTNPQRADSDLNLIVSASESEITMIDADGKEIPEEVMLRAIDAGAEAAKKVARFIAEFAAEAPNRREKLDIPAPEADTELADFVREHFLADMERCIFEMPGKLERFAQKAQLREQAEEKATEHFGEERDLSALGAEFDSIFSGIIRQAILEDGKRIAGRKLDEIRPLNIAVDVLPQVHGVGLFERGETQALSVLTLAGPGAEQIVEGIEGEYKKRYMHHYAFPPFSVGECSNRLMTGNREIGHGALAEKALEPVLPSAEKFPYVMRVATEILASNGSSSMASTCGSTLALMAGGVPISAPVSGIAMGLMTDPETGKFAILSDIQDEEDFGGDMDFKVAGTPRGITAIQMDTKLHGIPREVLEKGLQQAKEGRAVILEAMLEAIERPRTEIAPSAPRLLSIKIPVDKIRDVIGKGGETINGIIAETGADVNVEDDGQITVTAPSGDAAEQAMQMIRDITTDPEIGTVYTARITRIEPYGAFAEIKKGTNGLIHISLISHERIDRVEDVLSLGQEVRVKLVEIGDKGLRLSMKDVEE